jgi:hypothetical protein
MDSTLRAFLAIGRHGHPCFRGQFGRRGDAAGAGAGAARRPEGHSAPLKPASGRAATASREADRRSDRAGVTTHSRSRPTAGERRSPPVTCSGRLLEPHRYNTERIQHRLGWLSPDKYEAGWHAQDDDHPATTAAVPTSHLGRSDTVPNRFPIKAASRNAAGTQPS